MPIVKRLLLCSLVLASLTYANQATVDDFAFTPETIFTNPLEEILEAKTVSMEELRPENGKAALSRIMELPKLVTLKFFECDLSKLDENDPVSPTVTSVQIARSIVSQETIKWLSKYPAGSTLALGSCDLRGLQLELGKFKWVTISHCEISRSAVAKLVENTTQVTFKECTIVEDMVAVN